MSTHTLPTTDDFEIEVCYDPQQRKKKYYAEIRVRETGKLFMRTPFVATDEAATQTAAGLIREALEKHQPEVA
jgi:hypothetical protein